MIRYANRWTALLAWAALMGIVWAIFVPRGLSVGSFTLLALTGPLALLAGSALWGAHRPLAVARAVPRGDRRGQGSALGARVTVKPRP